MIPVSATKLCTQIAFDVGFLLVFLLNLKLQIIERRPTASLWRIRNIGHHLVNLQQEPPRTIRQWYRQRIQPKKRSRRPDIQIRPEKSSRATPTRTRPPNPQ